MYTPYVKSRLKINIVQWLEFQSDVIKHGDIIQSRCCECLYKKKTDLIKDPYTDRCGQISAMRHIFTFVTSKDKGHIEKTRTIHAQ